MENTVSPFRKIVDPPWLEVFETLYCGDPRISDVPMMNFWRSQDLYSDHMVHQFAFNGLPLARINNNIKHPIILECSSKDIENKRLKLDVYFVNYLK